jgi:MoxR-like ATPase
MSNPAPGLAPSAAGTDTDPVASLVADVVREVGRVVIGQDPVVTGVVGCLLVEGHALLEGVPGTAKTLLASAVARTLALDFARVQFTPDLLPADLTGTTVLTGEAFRFLPGPVFTNVLLADEINRTPAKTQSALLQAMQEGQVSVDGVSRPLPRPFLVLATQNPVESEGTYPLPEAQLDRFHQRILLRYPSAEAEVAMLATAHRGVTPTGLDDVRAVVDAARLDRAAAAVADTSVHPAVARYVVDVVRATRTVATVAVGASPRAAVHLLAAARVAARLAGRHFVTPDDVVAALEPVLAHRLVLHPEVDADRSVARDTLQAAVDQVPVPRLP